MRAKQLDKTLPKSNYSTLQSAGIDLYVREDTVVKSGAIPTLVPLNVVLEIPQGHFGLLVSRSSTAKKFGIILSNSVGIIDSDYCGEDDELLLSVLTIGNEDVKLDKGAKVAQIVIIPCNSLSITWVDKLSDTSRGGFGSTG